MLLGRVGLWLLPALAPVALFACGEADDGSSTIGSPSPSSTASSSSTASPSASSTTSSPSCQDGEQQECPCSDGSMASQLCVNGVFSSCACPLPPSAWNLLGCFDKAAGYGTCDVYCREQGRTCAQEGCNVDGSLTQYGYTWVSWPASASAACEALEPPQQVSGDSCTAPIWLQPSKAADDLVRCCCH